MTADTDQTAPDMPLANPAEPAEGTGAPEAAPDELDSLLSEYDEATGNGADEGAAGAGNLPEPEGEAGQLDPSRFASADDMAGLRAEIDQERLDRLGRQDTDFLIEQANAAVEGAPVGDDFAERWIRAEYDINPEFQAAWDGRYSQGEASVDRARRAMASAMKDLHKAASSQPDPALTEDRESVTAAVRGASKVDFQADNFDADEVAQMNDQQFAHWVKHVAPKLTA